MKLSTDAKLIAALALAAAGLIYFTTRRLGGVQGVASAAVGAVGDAAAGAVVGAGQLVGIPATNQTQCHKDLAAGSWWDASFSCPAGTFIGAVSTNVFGSTALNEDAARDARASFALTDPRRVDLGGGASASW